MFLTPVEIQHQPLRERRRGYDREDVDKLLEDAAASYEQVWREREELRARVTELEDELASFHDSERFLRETLVNAQRTAEKLHTDAKQEADRLIREALVDQERLKAEAIQELEDVSAEVKRLRSLADDLRSNLRSVLNEGLEETEGRKGPEEGAAGQTLPDALRPTPAEAEDRHD
jgi:cell division initiation protein